MTSIEQEFGAQLTLLLCPLDQGWIKVVRWLIDRKKLMLQFVEVHETLLAMLASNAIRGLVELYLFL